MLGGVRGEELVQVGEVLGQAQSLGDVGGGPANARTGASARHQVPRQRHPDRLELRLAHAGSYVR